MVGSGACADRVLLLTERSNGAMRFNHANANTTVYMTTAVSHCHIAFAMILLNYQAIR
jgi:hypothetical protein